MASSRAGILESERLVLRPYTSADAGRYLAMWIENSGHLREFIPAEVARLRSRAEMATHIGWLAAEMDASRLFVFGAWTKFGEFVGEAYLANPSVDLRELELGYFLTRTAMGKGFATEAARRVIDFAFQDLKADRLWAHIAADNEGSIGVVVRCGFQLIERRSDGQEKKDGSVVDLLIYQRT